MTNPQSSDWTDCPPHTITEFLSGERTASRRKLLVQGSLMAAGALTLGWFAIYRPNPADPDGSGISCDQFHAMVEEYLQGTLAGKPLAQVKAHLAHCPHCREHLQRLQSAAT